MSTFAENSSGRDSRSIFQGGKCSFSPCGHPWFWRTTPRVKKIVCLSSSVKEHYNSHSLRIYMSSNNVDLKNNNRNYRKSFWILCARIAAINYFQVDLDKSRNFLWYCYVRARVPHCPPFQKAGGQCPVIHPCSGVPDCQFRRIDHNGSQARIFSVPPVNVHITATY